MNRLRTVLVDGGSGSGKTTLARRLQPVWSELCGQPVQLVSLDDCYPGWNGLSAGSLMVLRDVLRPRSPGYRRWDWEHDRPGAWVPLDPRLPLVVEGCGALTRSSALLAQLSIWVELDVEERKRRALARDGEGFAPWWETWAEQEAAHWSANRPCELATVVVDGRRLGEPAALPLP
ncbi:cobalt ABC transporter [Luteococcus peritonei]|uniref:Cobalt ABC transporter n=1 Tax=Luteococcus peritonei TaxID=88874 RepID=A0ABW4RUX0_9ACTN